MKTVGDAQIMMNEDIIMSILAVNPRDSGLKENLFKKVLFSDGFNDK